jgi:hypothetical protein
MDPPNTNWATKALLNDLDLTVTAPSGQVYHGNNIQGDELNTVERVVVSTPVRGNYIISVTAKMFPFGKDHLQRYAIAVSSNGFIDEQRTFVEEISSDMLIYSTETTQCEETGKSKLIRIQLEDYNYGFSWKNTAVIAKDANNVNGNVLFSCTFTPNSYSQTAQWTLYSQCSMCLPKKSSYVISLDTSTSPNASYIRAAIPQCPGPALSKYNQISNIILDENGGCNECKSGRLSITMIAQNISATYGGVYFGRGFSWYL